MSDCPRFADDFVNGGQASAVLFGRVTNDQDANVVDVTKRRAEVMLIDVFKKVGVVKEVKCPRKRQSL